MKIKAYTSCDEWNNRHFYRNFDLIDKLPEIGDPKDDLRVSGIFPVRLDCENDDSVYDFDFFEIAYVNENGEDFGSDWVCVKKVDVCAESDMEHIIDDAYDYVLTIVSGLNYEPSVSEIDCIANDYVSEKHPELAHAEINEIVNAVDALMAD